MKNKKLFASIVTAVAFSTCGVISLNATNASADEVKTSQVNSPNTLDQYNEFIQVSNNQFVYENNSNQVSSQTLSEINTLLSETNAYVRDNNLTIDPKTKTATQYIHLGNPLLRSYGKNGILAVRWNSVRIGLDKGLVNDVLHAGIAGAAGYLGFLASGPGAAGVVAVASVIVDRHLDTKSGWWFDFNYFTRTVTGYGRQ
ncbi:hypothetical protein [Lactococcus lactis]|uniref:Secreted protein n=1 Tax=Lactococcus lactis TaxID=1358 RepID=A0AAP8JCJ2_9LACT|nr:hypothetical protein [Lactococcus lactis]MDG4972511.1 hypothetical protein [Lactococcus lactis]MDG4975030.1 hypothetical protein [Lactococcus lactis]PFG87323.1 hypothetical protein BW154_12745 [Lactococcus lactis]